MAARNALAVTVGLICVKFDTVGLYRIQNNWRRRTELQRTFSEWGGVQ